MERTKRNKLLTIKNDIDELNRVVIFLEELEEEWNLPPTLVPSVNLALEEALTNIIFYAYEKNTQNVINIGFETDGISLTIVLTDRGKPYDPTQKVDPDINLPAEERPIGGLGIFLIKKIMDEVSYQRTNNENQLKMIKKIT